jgi:hypothetical protein
MLALGLEGAADGKPSYNRAVLHMPHVVDRDHVDVAGRGDKDVGLCGGLAIVVTW